MVGVAFGLLIQKQFMPHAVTPGLLLAAKFSGTLFSSLLKMVLAPIVFLSVAAGVVELRRHRNARRVWQWALGYYTFSVTVAVMTGLILVNWVKPGVGLNLSLFAHSVSSLPVQSSLSEFLIQFIKGMFQNPIAALAGNDAFATAVFALIFAIGVIALGEKSAKTALMLEEVYEVFMKIIHWIMKVAPIGVWGLLLQLVATQNVGLFKQMGLFILVVLGGTLFHGFVSLPIVLGVLTRKNPYGVLWAAERPLLTAFSTASSSATIPVTLEAVQTNLKVDPGIAGFVVSVGATANMDGTALYEAVAALFIANLVGIHLGLGQQIIVAAMAMLASVGAPGIPSAGLVTMVMVLQSVGLPTEAIAILLPIDRLLDAFRTMVNVEGDVICAVIVQDKVGTNLTDQPVSQYDTTKTV